jgi:SAP domain
MSRWSEDRWVENPDGSYSRKTELPEVDYSKMRKADLVQLAERRALDTSGTKDELVERLLAADEE